jgi:Bacterial protein of unknown function (Gcw_chp)
LSKAGENCWGQICTNAYCVIKLGHIIADKPHASASYENTRLFRCFAGLALYLSNKWWNFFSPSLSGTVGFQSYEKNAADYTHWNAGLTLGFLEHWSADVRYYDTTYNTTECLAQSGGRNNCDARAVGTVKVTF